MLIKAEQLEQGTIIEPDGTIANRPTLMLSVEDAELLRKYKKFLERMHLREGLYCNDCWEGDREDGCKAFVQTHQIGIFCRCKQRLFMGMTT